MPLRHSFVSTPPEPPSSTGPGPYVLCPSSVEASRRLLYGVGRSVREIEATQLEAGSPGSGRETPGGEEENGFPISIPETLPSLEDSMSTFVPTAILFRTARWSEGPILLTDGDSVENPKFLASVYAADRVRDLDGERWKRIVVRAHLLPPVLPSEMGRRAEIVEETGGGIPLAGGPTFPLTRHLRPSELRMLHRMSLESQLAAITLLAAHGRAVAFVSRRGTWPASVLISQLSARLDCRVHRLRAGPIPRSIWKSMHSARYQPSGGPAGDA